MANQQVTPLKIYNNLLHRLLDNLEELISANSKRGHSICSAFTHETKIKFLDIPLWA